MKKKKWLGVLLAAIMVFTMTPMMAFAETENIVTYEGIRYRILDNNDNVEVIHSTLDEWKLNGPRSTYSGDVVIPANFTVNDIKYTVIGIDTSAFIDSDLDSLKLNEGLQYIDAAAFQNSSLTELVIPSTVTRIGGYREGGDGNMPLFGNENQLNSLTFAPNSQLTEIVGHRIFQGCTSLETIEIPAGVEDIGIEIDLTGNKSYGFLSYWVNMKNVTFAEGSKFENVDGILYEGDTLITTLDENIENIDVREGTKQIAEGAFYNCNKVENINLPDGLETIDNDAFNFASNVALVPPPIPGITIPGTTIVGATPAEVNKINIPSSVTSIGDNFMKGGIKEDGSTVVIFEGTTPPKMGEGTFANGKTVPYKIKIYYPSEAVNEYVKSGISEFLPSTESTEPTQGYGFTLVTNNVCPGKTIKIGTIIPTGGTCDFESSDGSILTVDEQGKITGVSGGSATVTAKIMLNDIQLAEREYTITVCHGNLKTINVTEASCIAEGYTGDKICEVCDAIVEKGESIPMIAHTYKDGVCTVCGTEDPNYQLPVDPTDPQEPTDPQQPEQDETGDAAKAETVEKDGGTATGDDSNTLPIIALMALAAAGAVGTALYGRKKRMQ